MRQRGIEMDFDEDINRFGTHSLKWDMMEKLYGVPASDGISMWVADMDFRPPKCVSEAIEKTVQQGVFGYYGDDKSYREAICWWMENRHNWHIEPEWIFTTHGLVNGTGMCVDAFTDPGDGVVLTTPVYHAFSRVVGAAGRRVVECPLSLSDGRYVMDFDMWDGIMDGSEKMMILCSPHNPGGRVWLREELEGIADFARRHSLVLVSDEIHHDLVYKGSSHIPMSHIADIEDLLVMMTATTKTFNIAGSHSGNVIISDMSLRSRFGARMAGLGISPNSFGLFMAEAAYSPEGATWVDDLMVYLDGNRDLFDEGVNSIPGLSSMRLESTYLAWVDFSKTEMDPSEFTRKVEKEAHIAVNHGPTFGKGGEKFLRFNLATPQTRVRQAVERLHGAFAS